MSAPGELWRVMWRACVALGAILRFTPSHRGGGGPALARLPHLLLMFLVILLSFLTTNSQEGRHEIKHMFPPGHSSSPLSKTQQPTEAERGCGGILGASPPNKKIFSPQTMLHYMNKTPPPFSLDALLCGLSTKDG